MWSYDVLALVLGTFFLAGLVKGVVGFGLPIVALALLASTIGVKAAIALIVAPGVVMNIWQATSGGKAREIFSLIWSMLLPGCAFIWLGVGILSRADPAVPAIILGSLLAFYAAYSLAHAQLSPPREWVAWLNPVVGALSGIAYGFTGSLMVPGVIYLQALGLGKNTLVQSLGITFLLMTTALAISLSGHNLLPRELGLLSALALVPAITGMYVGRHFRHRISEELFRKIFFWALLAAGLYMVTRALLMGA